MRKAVRVSAARTALGSFNGTLSPIGATQLGGIVIAEAVKRAGIEKSAVNEVSREDQDRSAVESCRRALAAVNAGTFADEIVPVMAPQRKGDPLAFTQDECPRESRYEALAQMAPAFQKNGFATAGTSAVISDGAAAVEQPLDLQHVRPLDPLNPRTLSMSETTEHTFTTQSREDF